MTQNEKKMIISSLETLREDIDRWPCIDGVDDLRPWVLKIRKYYYNREYDRAELCSDAFFEIIWYLYCAIRRVPVMIENMISRSEEGTGLSNAIESVRKISDAMSEYMTCDVSDAIEHIKSCLRTKEYDVSTDYTDDLIRVIDYGPTQKGKILKTIDESVSAIKFGIK